MSVQWYVLRGDQSEGPFTSSELKLLADQRQISPDTLVKQGMSGPWMPAGTIEGLFVEYHGAKPAPSTGSPPPVRYVKPKAPKKPVLAIPPTLAQAGPGPEPAPTGARGAEEGAAPGGTDQEAALPQPGWPSSQLASVEPSHLPQPVLQEPSPPAAPGPRPPEDLLSPIWYLRTPDGQQYGPVSKQQLDQWVAEGRVGEDCWLWRAGWPDWQGAGSLYQHLGQPLAPAGPAVAAAPAPGKPAERAEPAAPSAPSPGTMPQPGMGIREAPSGVADPQRWLGQTVGHYQLIHFIGRGPSGWVYQARHVRLDRLAAVRLIPTGGDRQLFEQLTQGLRAAVRLTHPHLVEVQDMGEAGGMVYVAMELMEGGSLADWIRRSGRLPAPAALGIFHQVALALAAVHTAGLLHRDIKPSNILFTGQGVAKLSDLGLAALSECRLRAGPAALGSTAYYMAPELFQGQPASVRSDLYSLGATFYHALCGHAPAEGIAVEEFIRQRGAVRVQPIGAVVSGLPPTMAAMIDRLLLKDPGGRFGSVKEVLEMLERMGSLAAGTGASLQRPAPGASPLPPGIAAPSVALPGGAGEEVSVGWWTKALSFLRHVSWQFWLALAGAVLVAVVLMILVFSMLSGGQQPPASEPQPSPSTPAQTPDIPPGGSS